MKSFGPKGAGRFTAMTRGLQLRFTGPSSSFAASSLPFSLASLSAFSSCFASSLASSLPSSLESFASDAAAASCEPGDPAPSLALSAPSPEASAFSAGLVASPSSTVSVSDLQWITRFRPHCWLFPSILLTQIFSCLADTSKRSGNWSFRRLAASTSQVTGTGGWIHFSGCSPKWLPITSSSMFSKPGWTTSLHRRTRSASSISLGLLRGVTQIWLSFLRTRNCSVSSHVTSAKGCTHFSVPSCRPT
mmetsp:Transcript_84464/g.202461  ORF Transcript_84464/g.202461 Transcript_84464/m.202461 type:complete len:247 (+) Transcript_84464:319-1059(+)